MNNIGRLVSLGLSTLLASFIAKKIAGRYSDKNIGNFIKVIVGFIILFMIATFAILFVGALIAGIIELFN